MSTDADKFLANQVVKLVPLPFLVLSAMSNDKFLANWVEIDMSLKLSDLVNLLKF